MLVSHRERFIYLKTFKTAGTSIEMALEHLCRPEHGLAPGTYYNGPDGIVAERGGRSAASAIRAHAEAAAVRHLVGRPTWDSYLKIAAVRNPYDKAVSMFWHRHHHDGLLEEPDDAVCVVEGFRRWIAARPRLPDDAARVSIRGKPCIDVRLRHESLDECLAALKSDHGIAARALPRSHGDFRRIDLPFSEYYDAGTAAQVAEHYALDFTAFGYDIGSWRQRRSGAAVRSAA